MINPLSGTIQERLGRSFVVTHPGFVGHSIYGPYRLLEPGDYLVEFFVHPADRDAVSNAKSVCAMDVVVDGGRRRLANMRVALAALKSEEPLYLRFSVSEPSEVEYRVHVTGDISLEIAACRRLHRLEKGQDVKALLQADRFPDATPSAPFFTENLATFSHLYELGLGVALDGEHVVLSMDGVRFYARTPDDMNFINEIFFERAYNMALSRDVCVIDIGMNIGLASLQFATKPFVKEVHAFEPFESTYERAKANLALNPQLAKKITATNAGLADVDKTDTFMVRDTEDSGARSTHNVDGGVPVQLKMLAAGTALRPIVERAKAAGRAVLAKIDCEGAEYAIFDSLEKSGLLKEISAFVVEWHGGTPGKSQATLIAPLLANGFTVIDRSPRVGQGVFYAVKAAI